MKKCKNCDKIFEPSSNVQKYCPDCQEVSIKCEFCGEDFEVKRWRKEEARFCSQDCYGSFLEGKENKALKKKWKEDKEFREYHRNHAKTLTGGNKKSGREKEREKRECPYCGTTFEVRKSSNQKYCSKECGYHSPNRVISHKLTEEDRKKAWRNASRNPSIQQLKLAKELEKYYEEVEVEYRIDTQASYRFADVAIPSLKLDFEYDGEYWHKNREKEDKERDRELEELDWSTIRFDSSKLKELQDNGFEVIKNEISL